MSRLYSHQTTPLLSVTSDTRVIEQTNVFSKETDVKFLVKCTPEVAVITLLNFNNGSMIQSDMSYDTAYALYMALSDALDTLEEDMIINTEVLPN